MREFRKELIRRKELKKKRGKDNLRNSAKHILRLFYFMLWLQNFNFSFFGFGKGSVGPVVAETTVKGSPTCNRKSVKGCISVTTSIMLTHHSLP